jgi:hypothetical protein
LGKTVEGYSHHAPDDEAQVILTADEVVGYPKGRVGANQLGDAEEGELRDEGSRDGEGTIGQIEGHPDLVGIAYVQLAFLPARGLQHRHDHGDREPVGDAEFYTADVATIECIAEEGHVHRIDGHKPDAGHADAVHPRVLHSQGDGSGQETDRHHSENQVFRLDWLGKKFGWQRQPDYLKNIGRSPLGRGFGQLALGRVVHEKLDAGR